MKPFRENVAIAIDGGGIKGTMVARALARLEEHLGTPSDRLFRLAAGTSTGAIISAGIATGHTGSELLQLYCTLGDSVFAKSLRSQLWPLTRYRYPVKPLADALGAQFGQVRMGDLWSGEAHTDVVITAFDLHTNRTRFIKPWKEEYAEWPVAKSVLASSSVPTYFPAVDGHLVDGGVGAYCNPCYLAAYELVRCLEWKPAETTLISLGTGRDPKPRGVRPNRWMAWDWILPVVGAFLQSADEQQVHLVQTFFDDLDFRRFQVDLREPIALDDPSQIPRLAMYGDLLGQKIIEDDTDTELDFRLARAEDR